MNDRIVFAVINGTPTASLNGQNTALEFLTGRLAGKGKTALLNIGSKKRAAIAVLDRESGTATFTVSDDKGTTELVFDGANRRVIRLYFEKVEGKRSWKFVRIEVEPENALVTETPAAPHPTLRLLPVNHGPVPDLSSRIPRGSERRLSPVTTPVEKREPPQSVPQPRAPVFTTPQIFATPPNGSSPRTTIPTRVQPPIRSKGRGNEVLIAENGNRVPIVSTMIGGNLSSLGFAEFLKTVKGDEPREFSLRSVPLLLVVHDTSGSEECWIVRPLEGNTLRLRSEQVSGVRIQLDQAGRRARSIVALRA